MIPILAEIYEKIRKFAQSQEELPGGICALVIFILACASWVAVGISVEEVIDLIPYIPGV